MPPTASPVVRHRLLEEAAARAARREPVTARALAQAAGTSTMAIYTHFGGMDGLWRSVRSEGFVRLADRLAEVPVTKDPVHDLVALSAAYAAGALANPNLYRSMFDDLVALDDPSVANGSFDALVAAAARAVEAGRFEVGTDPVALAARVWVSGHGVLMLVITGVLPPEAVEQHALPIMAALFAAAGDDPGRTRRSLRTGWATSTVTA